MKPSKLVTATAILGIWVSVCAVASNAQNRSSGAEQAAIKTLIAETTEAFNKHDAKAWARFCTPDARLVTVRGESMNGVAEIEKGLTAIFQTRGRDSTLTTLDVTVRFIRPDVALAHVTNQMSGLVAPDGQKLPPHRELSIRVLVKDRGVWRIAAFHNTMLQN
jgi:uncharacterized protein (TIGR02246 family)